MGFTSQTGINGKKKNLLKWLLNSYYKKKNQKHTNKTFLLIIWLGSFTYTILDFFYMQKQSSIWLQY